MSALRSRSSSSIRAPINDAPEGLGVILWRETDKAYKNAVETLSKVKSQQSVKVAEEDKSDESIGSISAVFQNPFLAESFSAVYSMKHYLELMPDAPDAKDAHDQMIIWEDKAKQDEKAKR